jgi:Glycosyl transferase family 90
MHFSELLKPQRPELARSITIVTPLKHALATTADLLAPGAYRRSRLARQLMQFCCKNSNVKKPIVTVAARQGRYAERHLVTIERRDNRLSASCLDVMILEHQNELFFRIAAVLVLVANAPMNDFHAVADISDGEDNAPNLLSFCSHDPRAILIPDHIFIGSRGYEQYRHLANASRTNWSARSDRIVWRGSTTGSGKISDQKLSADDPGLLLRVRLCLELQKTPGCDAKISAIAQSSNSAEDKERLARAGILGEFISPLAWHTFKFAIDVDGNSNGWSNLFTRLIMGCCVLKVASPLGFRQWYYSDLQPWTHYVPVKADLSDLQTQIRWCRDNPKECSRIAASGQAFAMARSYEAEIESGINRLSKALNTGLLRTSIPS